MHGRMRRLRKGAGTGLAAVVPVAAPQSALDPASGDAALVADLWWWMLVVSAVVGVVVLILLAVGLWRGRGRGREGGRPSTPSARLAWLMIVGGGLVTPLVASLAVVIASVRIGDTITSRPGAPAATIDVIGRLWWWEVVYRDASGEPIATTANEIHVPVGAPVRLRLMSDNVIHSFWVPNLQGKADVMPGQVNEAWLEAERPGVYRGQCAEFCGTQHAFMAFLVVAQERAAFEDWLQAQAAPAARPETELTARGRQVFLETSCKNCHTIRGIGANGRSGPDLTHLAARRTLAAATLANTRGHLAGWIADPQATKPGSLMPPTPMAPEDSRALLAYLETLR